MSHLRSATWEWSEQPGTPIDLVVEGPMEQWDAERVGRALKTLEAFEAERVKANTPEGRALAAMELHARANRCDRAEREVERLSVLLGDAQRSGAEARAEVERLRAAGWEAVLDANREMRSRLNAAENTPLARILRAARRFVSRGRRNRVW